MALVTGASMGAGRAIAKLLATHGMRVAACARSLENLQVYYSVLSMSCTQYQLFGGR